MSRVSKRTIHEDVKKELDEQLTIIISSLLNKSEVNLFLDEFLTNEEKVMLGKRLVMYMMIAKHIPSEDIHDILCLSYDTIRWYKHLYVTKPEIFKKMIQKLIKKEKDSELWGKIEKLLQPLDIAMQARSNMKARAKFINGEWFDK